MSRAAPLGDLFLPATPATGAFIAAFSWQPLAGGVMIGAEVGRTKSRVDGGLAPKYGRLLPVEGLCALSVLGFATCLR